MKSSYPQRLYGLHMAEGCAQYKEAPDKSHMVFVGEQAIKNMDSSYDGKPVFVGHRDDVNPSVEPDGHVVRSFFNKADGKHWVEFLVTSDAGQEAIRSGWKLSNAYKIKRSGACGRWHGIDYDQEVVEGEYDHLAIVNDPRYEESVIMTPEQFKEYNDRKEAELKKLQNSKTGAKGMFKFFKKEKVENSADLESMMVVLPKSKKEIEVSKLINEADDVELKKENQDPEYAVEHMLVKTNEGDLSVKDLVNKYNEMCESKKKENEEEKPKDEEKKENEEEKKEEDEKKENEDEEDKEVKKNNFNKLKNAHETEDETIIDLSMDQVARGKARYGSK